jgi:glucose-6-phosphate-specific signal transduction histidine kinase
MVECLLQVSRIQMLAEEGLGLARPETATGIGIIGMKERAFLVNGRVSIQSRSGEGTEVNVEVPLGAATA